MNNEINTLIIYMYLYVGIFNLFHECVTNSNGNLEKIDHTIATKVVMSFEEMLYYYLHTITKKCNSHLKKDLNLLIWWTRNTFPARKDQNQALLQKQSCSIYIE